MVDVPVVPRPAATLLVLGEGLRGPEVLMGRRHSRHAFMPNSLVFPGGGVDPGDEVLPVAISLPPHVRAILQKQDEDRLTHALGVALSRELEEETGLSLGSPPRLDEVDYLCRAITPKERSRRFDARFFVVSAAAVSGTLAGSGELDDLRFYSLEYLASTELEVATRGSLEQLRRWLAMTTEERRDRVTTPVMRERIWFEE